MNVGSAILHFCLCCPGQAQTGDHAASTEDTDGKKPGESLKRQVRGGRGSPSSAPVQGRAFPLPVWAVQSYTSAGAAPARHRLGTGRHRRRT